MIVGEDNRARGVHPAIKAPPKKPGNKLHTTRSKKNNNLLKRWTHNGIGANDQSNIFSGRSKFGGTRFEHYEPKDVTYVHHDAAQLALLSACYAIEYHPYSAVTLDDLTVSLVRTLLSPGRGRSRDGSHCYDRSQDITQHRHNGGH